MITPCPPSQPQGAGCTTRQPSIGSLGDPSCADAAISTVAVHDPPPPASTCAGSYLPTLPTPTRPQASVAWPSQVLPSLASCHMCSDVLHILCMYVQGARLHTRQAAAARATREPSRRRLRRRRRPSRCYGRPHQSRRTRSAAYFSFSSCKEPKEARVTVTRASRHACTHARSHGRCWRCMQLGVWLLFGGRPATTCASSRAVPPGWRRISLGTYTETERDIMRRGAPTRKTLQAACHVPRCASKRAQLLGAGKKPAPPLAPGGGLV